NKWTSLGSRKQDGIFSWVAMQTSNQACTSLSMHHLGSCGTFWFSYHFTVYHVDICKNSIVDHCQLHAFAAMHCSVECHIAGVYVLHCVKICPKFFGHEICDWIWID